MAHDEAVSGMELTTEQKWEAIKDAYPEATTGVDWDQSPAVHYVFAEADINSEEIGKSTTRTLAINDAYSRLPAKPTPEPLSGSGESDGEMGDFLVVNLYCSTCGILCDVRDRGTSCERHICPKHGLRKIFENEDARRRLTLEAAAESWHSKAGDRMAQTIANLVHLGRIDSRSEASDAMLDYMGKKGVPEPTVMSVFSPAPALKAQEGAVPEEWQPAVHFYPMHGTGMLAYCKVEDVQAMQAGLVGRYNDLASLAKKLASALNAVIERRDARIVPFDRKSAEVWWKADAEVITLCDEALAEAKKAGCA